jgi:hypothetical protein
MHNNTTIDAENNTFFYWGIAFVFFFILYIIIFSRLFIGQKNISIGAKIAYTTIVSIFHGLVASFITTMLIFLYVGV